MKENNMNTSIITQNQALQPRDITTNTVDIALRIGKVAWESGAFGSASEAQAAMVMLKAYELGFPMTAASEFIEVIDGKSQLKPLGAMAIMRAHPEIIHAVNIDRLVDSNGKFYGCKCTIERHEGGRIVPYTKQFTLQDAETAGLIKPKGNWEKYPEQMCQWRAVGFCADLACPDLLSGMTGLLKRGELMTDEDATTFDGTIEVQTVQTARIEAPAEPEITLTDLIARFGDPAVILTVNGGVMPQTAAECAEVARKCEEYLKKEA
jgi:hypothetical protein